MGVLGKYKNGNYHVTILDDGTKIRYNDFDSFNPEKPESMDLKITNKCYGNGNGLCPMCHENSCPEGKHGDILNLPFIDTLLPYTEIAIGGGNPLLHPDLIPFLEKLKFRKLIPNMTVNQWSFMDNIDFIKSLVDNELIYGLGVSLNEATPEFIEKVNEFPNAVIHVINGIITMEELRNIAHKNLKVLVLGYKEFRRGKTLYSNESCAIENAKMNLYNEIHRIIDEEWFDVVSFDNLAIKQLDPKRFMNDEEYSKFFMGEDGDFTLYVDMVNNEFAKSSTSEERFTVMSDIKDMFYLVR